jgi:hypothetical protein
MKATSQKQSQCRCEDAPYNVNNGHAKVVIIEQCQVIEVINTIDD